MGHNVSREHSSMKLAGGCSCHHFLYNFYMHVAGSLPLPPKGKPFASWGGGVGSHATTVRKTHTHPHVSHGNYCLTLVSLYKIIQNTLSFNLCHQKKKSGMFCKFNL